MLRRLFRPEQNRGSKFAGRTGNLIVGLGNPGAKYAQSRHNLGFMVMDRLGRDINGTSRERFQGQILETVHNDETLILLKPLTFMNNSGQSVAQVARWYKIPPERILIVYDELDLPFGTIRLRPKGSAGGHNGLASVIKELGTNDIPRLRIGIGRPTKGSTVSYVLSRFFENERPEVPGIVDLAAEASLSWLDDGIEAAMNRYNRQQTSSQDAVKSQSD